MCEFVLAQVLPDVLDRVQLRGVGRLDQEGDVVGHFQLGADVPASTLNQIDCGLFQATFGDPDFECKAWFGGCSW